MWSRVLVALAFTLAALVAAPAEAATPSATYASKIMSATNTVRVNHALPKLRGNDCVRRFEMPQRVTWCDLKPSTLGLMDAWPMLISR